MVVVDAVVLTRPWSGRKQQLSMLWGQPGTCCGGMADAYALAKSGIEGGQVGGVVLCGMPCWLWPSLAFRQGLIWLDPGSWFAQASAGLLNFVCGSGLSVGLQRQAA